MSERWNPVYGNAWYEVSDLGRVRSVSRELTKSDGRMMRVIGRPISQRVNADGYLSCWLSCWLADGRTGRTCRVHTLVLEAFVGPRASCEMQCRHLDGDRLNNRATNLAWGTCAENAADRITHGTMPAGETHVRSKLTADAVMLIRADPERSSRSLAAEFGVSHVTINRVRRNETWRNL